MLPLVAIEVPVGEPPQQIAAMVEACTAALAVGRCVIADADKQTPTALAVVSWFGSEHLKARVEVGQRASAESSVSWHRRDLSFGAVDSAEERWKAVGYTIATIVGELEEAESKLDAAGKRTKPQPVTTVHGATSPPAAPPPNAPKHWVELGPQLVLDSERTEWGAFLGAGMLLTGPFGAEAQLAYSGSGSDSQGLASSRWRIGGYAGLVGEGAGVGYRLMLGPVLERVGVSVDDTGDADSAGRWLAGISIRISGVYALSQRLQLLGLASVTQLSGATDVRVRRRSVSRIPSQSLTLGIGVGSTF